MQKFPKVLQRMVQPAQPGGVSCCDTGRLRGIAVIAIVVIVRAFGLGLVLLVFQKVIDRVASQDKRQNRDRGGFPAAVDDRIERIAALIHISKSVYISEDIAQFFRTATGDEISDEQWEALQWAHDDQYDAWYSGSYEIAGAITGLQLWKTGDGKIVAAYAQSADDGTARASHCGIAVLEQQNDTYVFVSNNCV